jgi:hypothetical protein
MSDFLNAFNGLPKTVPDIRVKLPYSGKEILMRPFNTKEQMSYVKALETDDFKLVQASLDQILKNCVLNEDFNIDELVSKERDILLISLRIESVSEEYTLFWTCTNEVEKDDKKPTKEGEDEDNICGHENKETIDLDTLKLEEPKGEFETTIKLTDKECDVRIGVALRGKETEAVDYIEKKTKELEKKDEQIDDYDVYNAIYASIIRSATIGDKTFENMSFEDRLNLIEGLHLNDRKQIENFTNQTKGLEYNLKREVTCSKCKKKQTENLDWLSFFMV